MIDLQMENERKGEREKMKKIVGKKRKDIHTGRKHVSIN